MQAQIDEVDAKLTAWHRADECSRRLAKIPGVGPIGAALLTMKTPDPDAIPIGTPVRSLDRFNAKGSFDRRQSQARRYHARRRRGIAQRAGGRSYLGDPTGLRGGKASPWLAELLKRKSPKLAAVALANKTARIAWKMMLQGKLTAAKSAPPPRQAQPRDQPDTGSN